MRDAATSALNLRAGDWVEVRSLDEILATLDGTQAVDGLPFMPEMVQYCGKRYRVSKSAHKTCDTVESYLIRRAEHVVHLENLRCDGQGHDGCQCGCLIYWKEAWLKRVDGGHAAQTANAAAIAPGLIDPLRRATRVDDPAASEPRYRCQSTDLVKFTSMVRRRERWDPRFYFKDLTSGNVTIGEFLTYGARAMVNAFSRKWFNRKFPHIQGRVIGKTPAVDLQLQVGELVQVRSKAEIEATISPEQRNRGLWFDIEMVSYCNTTARVLSRVNRIIDEKTGKMITLPNPCVILDGVVCTGHNSVDRMFCPRAIYPYWREVWLKRVSGDEREA
jgi:hypothetical protein